MLAAPRSIALIALLGSCFSAGFTLPPEWVERFPQTGDPDRRSYHSMAYDSAREVVVLFGAIQVGSDETWEWDGGEWIERHPATTIPNGRYWHSMAYDAARGRTMMFGGQVFGGAGRTDELWEWDGSDWKLVPKSGSWPTARIHSAMVYDPGNEITLLFGGSSGDFQPFDDDLWRWDGAEWIQVQQTTPWPSERIRHAMAFDSVRDRLVLFGGYDGFPLDDLWEWTGSEWIERSVTPMPAKRHRHPMCFDSSRGVTILFGGSGEGGVSLGDTWEWDGSDWTQSFSTDVTLQPSVGR